MIDVLVGTKMDKDLVQQYFVGKITKQMTSIVKKEVKEMKDHENLYRPDIITNDWLFLI